MTTVHNGLGSHVSIMNVATNSSNRIVPTQTGKSRKIRVVRVQYRVDFHRQCRDMGVSNQVAPASLCGQIPVEVFQMSIARIECVNVRTAKPIFRAVRCIRG